LQAALAGLAAQTRHDFRVWVCIDGSTDGTQTWAAHPPAYPFSVAFLEHPGGQNLGRNATRNLALPHLQAPITVMLDTDLVPVPTLLQAHWDLLQVHHFQAISAGKVWFTNAETNLWAHYQNQRGKAKFAHAAQLPFQYLTTGNLAMPTAAFVQVGGQDPAMRSWGGGDTEFAWRVWQAFRLPLFYNQLAVAAGDMDKSLHKALAQHRAFGADNFVYIRHKHPAFTSVFRADLLTGTSIKAHLLQFMLAKPFRKMSEIALRWPLPRKLQIGLVHYLTIANIRAGWCDYLHARPTVHPPN
jgi:glycosyltransferase involved in cell wall biosynthesis